MVSDILSDNDARKEEFGANSYLYIPGFTVAAKTGTTDDKRDNWTLGYTPSVAVGAWVGNNDNSAMNQALASGITGAAPIWNRIMRAALSGKKNEPFVRPSNIIEMDVDAYGGGTPVPSAATRKERFIKGTEPTGPAYIYKNVKVSRHDNNKLANAVEVGNGQYDLKQYVVFAEADPISTDGHNRWQEAIDPWVATQGDSKFHPPTDTYQGTDTIGMNVKSPKDMTRVDSNSVTVDVAVSTLNDLDRVEISLDGSIVQTVHDKNVNVTITVANGSHIIHLEVVDTKGNHASNDLHVGINADYVAQTPTPASP
jgi:membrane carboxypeptidase/penicillin-binding protein PbpC